MAVSAIAMLMIASGPTMKVSFKIQFMACLGVALATDICHSDNGRQRIWFHAQSDRSVFPPDYGAEAADRTGRVNR